MTTPTQPRPGLTAMVLGALVALCVCLVDAHAAETGELVVRSKPAGADITIDGELVGKAPVTKSLGAGKHEVGAAWPDGSSGSAHAKVAAGASTTLWIKPQTATAEVLPQPSNFPHPYGPSSEPPAAPEPPPADVEVAAVAPPPPPPPPPPPLIPGPGRVTLLPKPIPSPLHPRNRMTPGTSLGLGVYCPDYGTRSIPYGHWCTAQLRVSMDGPFADMHAALLLGDMLRVGGLIGFEMGTRYMQLGNKRQRLALALRGSFDLLIAHLGHPMPGQFDDGLLGFSNTYGPHFSVALSPGAALEVRGAVGWTVGGFWSNHEGFPHDPVYGFVAEGWIGMRVAP